MGKLHVDGICSKQQNAAMSNHWLEAELSHKRGGDFFFNTVLTGTCSRTQLFSSFNLFGQEGKDSVLFSSFFFFSKITVLFFFFLLIESTLQAGKVNIIFIYWAERELPLQAADSKTHC